MFNMEATATATSLQLNNTALSDVVDIQYALVGELKDRVRQAQGSGRDDDEGEDRVLREEKRSIEGGGR